MALGCAPIAAGLSAATLRASLVAHPVLARLERKEPAKPAFDVESPLATPGDIPVAELPEEPQRWT